MKKLPQRVRRLSYDLACRHLKLKSDFGDALAATLQKGGDTDTNAAIVGGMIGAFHGSSKIPQSMLRAVLERDTSQGPQRPDFLLPSQAASLADQLYKCGTEGSRKSMFPC